MAADAADIVDTAIDWHLRQSDMDATEWHAFVAWLEADAAHARAFDAVALDMAMLSDRADLFPPEVVETSRPAPSVRPRRVRAWAGGGIAIAASLTLMLASSLSGTATYAIETKPGERRDVALNDGTRIELNGATRLVLDRADPRVATLESGEATFHVRHDAANPFTLRSGELVVQDMGTVFDVARDGARLDVQVAEGSVLFQPRREAVTLGAGAGVSVREDLGRVALVRVDADRVGAWRSGTVAFAAEPFGRVSVALRRIDGVAVSIDPILSRRPFTGMVRLSGKAAQDVPHVAALIGAQSHRDGDRWYISPP